MKKAVSQTIGRMSEFVLASATALQKASVRGKRNNVER